MCCSTATAPSSSARAAEPLPLASLSPPAVPSHPVRPQPVRPQPVQPQQKVTVSSGTVKRGYITWEGRADDGAGMESSSPTDREAPGVEPRDSWSPLGDVAAAFVRRMNDAELTPA